MQATLFRPKPRRSSPARSRTRVGQASPMENRSAQTARTQQRSSRLDNPYWRPYRNSEDLAQQVYALTHPDGVKTFAELERDAEINQELAPYREAVVHLSALLR